MLSVTITETINQADTFQLTVREHNPKPERFAGSELRWLDSTVFDEGNKIDIELGYQGNRGIALSGQISGLNVGFPGRAPPRSRSAARAITRSSNAVTAASHSSPKPTAASRERSPQTWGWMRTSTRRTSSTCWFQRRASPTPTSSRTGRSG